MNMTIWPKNPSGEHGFSITIVCGQEFSGYRTYWQKYPIFSVILTLS